MLLFVSHYYEANYQVVHQSERLFFPPKLIQNMVGLRLNPKLCINYSIPKVWSFRQKIQGPWTDPIHKKKQCGGWGRESEWGNIKPQPSQSSFTNQQISELILNYRAKTGIKSKHMGIYTKKNLLKALNNKKNEKYQDKNNQKISISPPIWILS